MHSTESFKHFIMTFRSHWDNIYIFCKLAEMKLKLRFDRNLNQKMSPCHYKMYQSITGVYEYTECT